ncbi:hypothetical protein TRVL_08424 [Trypanosoma vivax]|nr:hypothetical protein TRVL_08424 [Trypanosoma vivax]
MKRPYKKAPSTALKGFIHHKRAAERHSAAVQRGTQSKGCGGVPGVARRRGRPARSVTGDGRPGNAVGHTTVIGGALANKESKACDSTLVNRKLLEDKKSSCCDTVNTTGEGSRVAESHAQPKHNKTQKRHSFHVPPYCTSHSRRLSYSKSGTPLQAGTSGRVFRIAVPLLASRVRKLLGRQFSTHSQDLEEGALGGGGAELPAIAAAAADDNATCALTSHSLISIGRADEDALSCFFPAVHSGEWFETPRAFVDHFNSVSHKLLCEDAPLFPLELDRECPGPFCDPELNSSGAAFAVRSQTTTAAALGCEAGSGIGAGNHGAVVGQHAFYWWFMHIHLAVMRFSRKEWLSQLPLGPLVRRHKRFVVAAPIDDDRLRSVGELWCGCRALETSVALAVAKRIVTFPTAPWHILREAAMHVARIARCVYLTVPCMRDFAAPSHCPDDDLMQNLTASVTSASVADAESRELATSAISVLLLTESSGPQHVALSVCEAKSLAKLSVYIASSIVAILKVCGGVDTEGTAPSKVDCGASATLSAPYDLANVNRGEVDDGKEQMLGLVLWLHLRNMARNA